jgi:hypothetical protein
MFGHLFLDYHNVVSILNSKYSIKVTCAIINNDDTIQVHKGMHPAYWAYKSHHTCQTVNMKTISESMVMSIVNIL